MGWDIRQEVAESIGSCVPPETDLLPCLILRGARGDIAKRVPIVLVHFNSSLEDVWGGVLATVHLGVFSDLGVGGEARTMGIVPAAGAEVVWCRGQRST